jgi:hypothetical protein
VAPCLFALQLELDLCDSVTHTFRAHKAGYTITAESIVQSSTVNATVAPSAAGTQPVAPTPASPVPLKWCMRVLSMPEFAMDASQGHFQQQLNTATVAAELALPLVAKKDQVIFR